MVAGSRGSRLIALALATAALCVRPAGAQRSEPAASSLQNMDIRTAADAAAAAYLERFASDAGAAAAYSAARDAGLTRLRAALGDVEVLDSLELGTPEVVGVKP